LRRLAFGDNSKAALLTRSGFGDAAVGRGVRRAGRDVYGFERVGRFDGHVFLQTQPQPRIWRAIGSRGESGSDRDQHGGRGRRLSTARSARELARRRKVVTPVIDEVYAMLYEGKDARKAVQDLTARESKAED